MTENINHDNQSLAPSQNPSQAANQYPGHSQGETIVPRHSDIKGIESQYKIDMKDPRIEKLFPWWERTKL